MMQLMTMTVAACLGHFDSGGATADGQHVGVIVLASHLRRVVVVAQRAPNAVDFVAGDGDADARAAYHNAAL
jgi:hypothetical protein